MAQLECYRNKFLKSKILKLTKTTSRFNFNKLVSLPPIDHIHFAFDVTSKDLEVVHQEIQRLQEQRSIRSVMALANYFPRGV